jgi:hypothetical protein
VQPGDPDVGINPIVADIVFGAPKKDDTVASGILPDTSAPIATSEVADFTDEGLFPAERVVTDRPKPSRNPTAPSRSSASVTEECRTATVNDFAPESSPDLPGDRRPTEGVYRWKRGGTRTFLIPGFEAQGPQTQEIKGFEERVVQNVKPYNNSTTDFQYDTVQKDLEGNLVTTTWRVRQSAENRNVNNNFPPVRANVGEPDRGLSLVSIVTRSPKGDVIDTFSPRLPLLYLPLETTISDSFRSSAVDPRTFVSLEIDGAVSKHAEVDACGSVVDGWLVNSTLTTTTPEGQYTSKFDYIVANQFGSMVISTHQETPSEEPTSKLDFSLARVTPTPLPAP